MKNNSYSALHVICGSVNQVELENGNFIISVEDKYIYEHLTDAANFNLLKRAFTWQDLNLNIVVKLVGKPVYPQDEDIKKLKNLVGKFLQVQE